MANDTEVQLVASTSGFDQAVQDSSATVQQFADDVVDALSGLEIGAGIEDELEALNTNLSEVIGSMRGVENQSEETFEEVEEDAARAESGINDLAIAVTAMFAAWLGSQAISQAADALWGFVQAGAESQDAAARLEGVVAATGEKAGWTAEQLASLADQLEKTTRFEAETTMAAEAMLTKFDNIRGDIFTDAVKGAADMASAMGTDLTSAIHQVGRALDDPIEGLTALRRAGINFSDAQKEQIETMLRAGQVQEAQRVILDALQAKFGGMAEHMGSTFAGKMEIAQHKLGNIAEAIGISLMPAFDALFPLVDQFIVIMEAAQPVIDEVVTGLIQVATGIYESVKPAFGVMLETLVAGWTAAEIWSERWDDVLSLVGKKIEYEAVRAYNIMAYYFGKVIPELGGWFARNWSDILQDWMEFQQVVLTNVTKNIGSFIDMVRKIMSGDIAGGIIEFSALTKGFELSLKELPIIAEREIGELEKQLKADMDSLGADLGTDFGTRMNDNLARIRDILKAKSGDAGEEAAKEFDKKFDIDVKAEKKVKEAKEKKDKEAKDETKDEVKSSFEGLEALTQRIQAAAAGMSEGDKMKDAGKEMKEAADRFAAAAKEAGEREGIKDLKKIKLPGEDKAEFEREKDLEEMMGLRPRGPEDMKRAEMADEFDRAAEEAKNVNNAKTEEATRDVASVLREWLPQVVDAANKAGRFA